MNLQKDRKMKTVKKLLASVAVLACSSAAFATEWTINFQTMADVSWGESAWQPLGLDFDGVSGVDVEIRGKYGQDTVYAYLDASTAGLGTCRELSPVTSNQPKVVNTKYTNGKNLCKDSADDNVNIIDSIAEELEFTFLRDLNITGIWFNNNHDSPKSLKNDTIKIGSSDYTFTGDIQDSKLGWLYSFTGTSGFFNINDILNIKAVNEQFYISAVIFNDDTTDTDEKIPVPSTLVLLGLGLAGLGARKCRK